MKNKTILFFTEINKNDINLVGGKGANLGEMMQLGIPVPNGFCITTTVFKEFMSINNIYQKISGWLQNITPNNVGEISNKVRKIIVEGTMPDVIKEDIKMALKKFSKDDFFSIRSSATAEDLEFASFAGQQDTYLNIKGEQNIFNYIKKCWASLYTERAILYRVQNDINSDEVTMAVVIQRMVMSESSGIMFTADPISGNRNIISIDAGFGLGEALVSGLVSPDIYKVQKETNKIIKKVVSYKKLAIFPVLEGGTITRELTKEDGNKQVLDESMIQKLSNIAKKLEKHYGKPQDIEWCIEKNELFIVQSRSITSLYPLPNVIPKDKRKHVYVSVGHMQSMLNTLSPLGLDLMPMIFRVGNIPIENYRSEVMPSAGGRLYIDMTGIMHTKFGKKNIPNAFNNADILIGKALKSLVKQGVFDEKRKLHVKGILKTIWLFKGVPIKVIGLMFFKDTSSIVTTMDKTIKKISDGIKKEIKNSEEGSKRLEVIYTNMPLIKVFAKSVIPYLLAGILSMKILEKISIKSFGNNAIISEMKKGLHGNVTTEMGLLLGDLADYVRVSPKLQEIFRSEDYLTLFDRVDSLKGHEEFKNKFKQFFDTYGCRANGEIDIAKTRWEENPEQITRSIMSMVKGMSQGQHRTEFDETEKLAKEKCREFIAQYEKKKGKIKGLFVRRMIKVMRHALPIREHHKFMLVSIYSTIKASILKDANNLVNKGSIDVPEDIFWLRFSELYKAYNETKDLRPLINQRKEEYKHYNKFQPPRVMTSEGEIIHGTYDKGEYPPNALVGIAVSSGIIEGIAKVIKDPSKETLEKGEILVASFTDPSWTPLFLNAAGLVMEVGGQLTHGTVVAREYGLPAVVGVDNATSKIKSGDRIRIDGNVGYIVILKNKS